MLVGQEGGERERRIDEDEFFENLCQALLFENSEEAKNLFEIYKKTPTQFKNTSLHYCAKKGYLSIINKLLFLDVKIDELNSEGKTALLVALENRHLAFAKNLIEHPLCVSLLQQEINLIVEKFLQGNINIFEACLKKGFTTLLSTQITHDKKNLLLYALYANCLHLVPTLLEYGMNVDEVDTAGNSALHYAANSIFLEIDLFKKIMRLSSNINLLNNRGASPIYFALNACREDFVSLLLDQKASVNIHSSTPYHLPHHKYGNIGSTTPIHYCIVLGRLFLLKLFKDYKEINDSMEVRLLSDPPTIKQTTVLHLAVEVNSLEILCWYLENGFNPNTLDSENTPALFYAALLNRTAMVIELIKHGTNLEVILSDSNPLLFSVISKSSIEIINLFLDHIMSIHLENNAHQNILHIAVLRGKPNILRSILDKKVSLELFNTRDLSHNLTPYDLAIKLGKQGIADILLKKFHDLQNQMKIAEVEGRASVPSSSYTHFSRLLPPTSISSFTSNEKTQNPVNLEKRNDVVETKKQIESYVSSLTVLLFYASAKILQNQTTETNPQNLVIEIYETIISGNLSATSSDKYFTNEFIENSSNAFEKITYLSEIIENGYISEKNISFYEKIQKIFSFLSKKPNNAEYTNFRDTIIEMLKADICSLIEAKIPTPEPFDSASTCGRI